MRNNQTFKSEVKPFVLIVDDVPANIQVLAEALMSDYRIKVATSGKAAFDVIERQGLPDLILLDIMMPEMDGYEVCRILKDNPRTSTVPVIFVTAKNEVEDEEYGLNIGAVDYITKPFHISIIKARLRNQLRLREMTRLLEQMAWVDGLTCIPNRRRFDEVLHSEWHRALRAGDMLSVAMMDIDFFKLYNDGYGHGPGDNCLRQVAAILNQCVTRSGDLIARYGGEEFVLLMPGTSNHGACKLAEYLRSSVQEQEIPHQYSKVSPFVSLSIGCATMVPDANFKPQQLLEAADHNLYRAKQAGRNQIKGAEDTASEPADHHHG